MFALRGTRLFDGDRTLDLPTVLVDDGRISAVGVTVPDGMPVFELGDVTLAPGFFDSHQHLCFDGSGPLEEQVSGIDDAELTARARSSARRALEGGITTLRDLGDRGFLTVALRGEPSLPTVLAAGPPITRPGGHCWFLGGECAGEADLRRAVRERIDRQCDVVKVMATGGFLTPTYPMWEAQFTLDELRLVVDEAHRGGLPVAAHCHGIVGIERALDAGADTIEHCTFYTRQARPDPPEPLLDRLASSGVAISATLGRLPGYPLTADQTANASVLVGARRRLYQLGATLIAGSDAGITPAKPHDVLSYAFADLIEIGLDPFDALRALTSGPARACGLGQRKGRLAPGFDADIIAIAGNALTAETLGPVVAVWHDGNRVR